MKKLTETQCLELISEKSGQRNRLFYDGNEKAGKAIQKMINHLRAYLAKHHPKPAPQTVGMANYRRY